MPPARRAVGQASHQPLAGILFPQPMSMHCRFPAPILVLAPHPDDESAGIGGLIARCVAWGLPLYILFLTDGAPRNRRYFAPGFRGSHAAYRATRRTEALTAAAALGIPPDRLAFGPIPDLELAAHWAQATRYLDAQLRTTGARTLLVPAAENGHPDHDAAHRLALDAHRATRGRLAAWEYPLYACHRGHIRFGWLPPSRNALALPLNAREQATKRQALAAYLSQHETLASFPATCEDIRPLRRRRPRRHAVWQIWGLEPPEAASGIAAPTSTTPAASTAGG